MSRIKNIIDKLKEAKQVGNLYHYTKYESALSILTTNKLIPKDTGYNSFTRNKNFHKQGRVIKGMDVCFVVDGDSLSNNYKIEPYKYHNIDIEVADEQEERVTQIINNFNKYIKEIIVFKNPFPNDESKKHLILSRYLNRVINSDNEFITFEDYIDYLNTFNIPIKII